MNITHSQIEAAKRGEAVRLNADNVEIVVVRADIYDQFRRMTEDPRETYASVLKVLDQEDDNVDQYLEYLDESR